MALKPVTHQELHNLIQWCAYQVNSRGKKGVVVALSGGADSALVAKLFAMVTRVLCVNIPIESSESAAVDAHRVAEWAGVELLDLPLDSTFQMFQAESQLWNSGTFDALSAKKRVMVWGNAKARLRTTLARAWAEANDYLFINTCNWSETIVGYETKGGGDADGDLAPLRMFVKACVWKMLKMLNAPQWLIEKIPSADLEPGQTDEEDMGLTYKTLDTLASLQPSGELDGMIDVPDVATEDLERFHQMVRGSAHKRDPMPYFERSTSNFVEEGGIQRDEEFDD